MLMANALSNQKAKKEIRSIGSSSFGIYTKTVNTTNSKNNFENAEKLSTLSTHKPR